MTSICRHIFMRNTTSTRQYFDIRTLVIIGGDLPSRVLGMVVEWASLHREELLDLWERAVNHESLYKLPPLK